MTFSEITALTVESVFFTLLDRILDLSSIPEGSPAYMLDEDETKSFYDRVIIHQSLVKPAEELFIAELAEYKTELEAIEQARLDEIARVEDIKSRFGAIVDIRGAIFKAGLEISNPAIELKRIIESNDTERLSLLESKGIEFVTEETVKAAKESRKAQGGFARKICNEILDIVAGYNIENALTSAQKDQMQADYSSVLSALSVFRPMKAKPLIEAIIPDGTIVSQDLKDEILAVYSDNGL